MTRTGQLGNNTTQKSSVPVDVSGLAFGVSGIVAGSAHTCAITAEGVMCWGDNGKGQLGNHSNSTSLAPVKVSGTSGGVKAVAAGTSHTCAIYSDGGLRCWGANDHGQLGDQTTKDSNIPIDVVGLSSGVLAVATGQYSTCAVVADGTAECWGAWKGSGENADASPTAVAGISSLTAISGGAYHTCALATSGAVYCWGSSWYGRLGNPDWKNGATPVQAIGVTAKAIAAGGTHTCALTTADGVMCWGYNASGQVGNNSKVDVTKPTNVSGF